MAVKSASEDIGVELADHVALVELRRPPHNFFSHPLIANLADIYEELDKIADCRTIVLAAAGKSFCAGADFSGKDAKSAADSQRATLLQPHLYKEANRLFRTRKPVVAAVQGPAIGGGLGLAMSADFRVTCPEARFSANFTRLGFHAGFGLTATLPRVIGAQKAALLFYTGRRIDGAEATAIGMADILTSQDQVRAEALRLAREIADSAPLAVLSMRHTLRRGFIEAVEAATDRELGEQNWQRLTEDFKEGTRASAERRMPIFHGK